MMQLCNIATLVTTFFKKYPYFYKVIKYNL